jgi:phosphatidylglycerophosphate synthase
LSPGRALATDGRVRRAVVFALPRSGAPDPTARLGGLPLATRAMLSLRRAGLTEIALVSTPDVANLVHERAPRTQRFDDLTEAVRGRCLVLRHDQIVATSILRSMSARREPGVATVGGRRLGVTVVDRESLPAWEEGLPATPVTGWQADAGDHEEALRRLLDDCRKPVDGFVARHCNRHLSLALTKRLVDHPAITPNAMTGVMLAVSLAGAFTAARGGYSRTLGGAALMQLGSILDGVDGEVARLRFEESALGAWLDTLADDLTNVAFWGALARGAPRRSLRRAGNLTALANALAALVNYAVLARRGTGDLTALPEPPRRGLARAIALLLKQDAFLALTLALALAGRLHRFLPFAAAGALITLAASTARAVSIEGSKPWASPPRH